MPQRRPRHPVLSAAVCALVLLASGDDFNLARVVLPLPTTAAEASLPLDDPNTDFTARARAEEQAPAGRQPCDGPEVGGPVLVPAAVALPARGRSARNPILSPLRC